MQYMMAVVDDADPFRSSARGCTLEKKGHWRRHLDHSANLPGESSGIGAQCGSDISKTPKIISQVQTTPEYCACNGCSKCTHRRTAVARQDARSQAHMQAHKHGPSGFPVHIDPGTGSCTAEAHNKHMSATQHAQTVQITHAQRHALGGRSMSGTQLQLQPLARLALQAHGTGPLGHSGAAPAPIVDSISSRFSAASRDACNQGKAIATQLW
jgi:hypothetical protein